MKRKDILKYVPREHNNKGKDYGKSVTIPGQAFTVKQIKEYIKRGINMDILKRGIYDIPEGSDEIDENPYRNVKDLTDIDKIKADIDLGMETIDRIKKVQQSRKNEAKKAKEKEDIIQEYLANLKKDQKDAK